ncbi:CdaR family protein [Streptococcus sp. NLN64]|uniref:CdaR family protein n=1 Tax=Streptococcus sp. NLN64 TaxID=2822799 RepID=UPI0018C94CDB|nr:CdaR family protein [Streptococcus sp. NLN64]MBG9366722.1 hypothetical protein [Streptococcus sp. NLN64]
MKLNRSFLYALLATFLSLILFFYASSSQYQTQAKTSGDIATETYTNTIKGVPLVLRYDSDKYFVSGFASEVTVDLSSSNRVLLSTETQESSRTFRVVADLTNESPGLVEVPVTIEHLTSGVTAKVEPESISGTIGLKKSKTFKVDLASFLSQIPGGASLMVADDDKEVSVTSNEELLAQISAVQMVLPEDWDQTKNYNGEVSLQAVDANGEVVPSVIEPETISIRIQLKTEEKK